MNKFLRAGFGLLCLSLIATAHAGIPAEVNGQPVPSLAPMLQKVTPGVVNIATESETPVPRDPFFDDPFFRRFFNVPNTPRMQRVRSLGSGVIVDAKHGYVLTNNHVIAKADKITVQLQDGRRFSAKLVGTDPESDIAVLHIPAKHLTAVPLGNSDDLRVGDFVVAVGNPFGLGQTVTSGIVSALGRSGLGIEGYEDFIQTDASINPGNSGGALVNLRGQLVGINTAIYSRSGGNIGIGFAIPINMVNQVRQQLVKYGHVRRGALGLQAQNLTPELSQAFGIDQRNGAVVTRVTDGSAADRAGIKTGDVIIAVNGQPVDNATKLRNAIGLLSIGQQVRLTLLRDGKRVDATATIAKPKVSKLDAGALNAHLAGVTLGNIGENSPLYGSVKGVVVLHAKPGSPAWQAGLRDHDVVVAVNRQPVRSLSDVRRALAGSNGVLLNIRRGDGAFYLLLR